MNEADASQVGWKCWKKVVTSIMAVENGACPMRAWLRRERRNHGTRQGHTEYRITLTQLSEFKRIIPAPGHAALLASGQHGPVTQDKLFFLVAFTFFILYRTMTLLCHSDL